MFGDSRSGAGSSSYRRQSGSSSRQRLTREQAFGDDDEEEHFAGKGGAYRRSNDQQISSFTANGSAEGSSAKQSSRRTAPIIQAQGDADWMTERKRRLGGAGGAQEFRRQLEDERMERRATNERGGRGDRIGDEEQHVGLVKRERAKDEGERVLQSRSASPAAKDEPMDEDTVARAALLNGASTTTDQASGRRVIAVDQSISEQEALTRDMRTRPDAPTLADYAGMPVEEFGAALLRGMGWKPGTGAGRQRQGPVAAPEVKKRAALLGLGAKERDMPSFLEGGKRSSKARSDVRSDRRYVPVTRKDNGDAESGSRQRSRSPHSHDRSRDHDRERRRYDEDRDRTSSRSYRDRHHDSRSRDDKDRRRDHRKDY